MRSFWITFVLAGALLASPAQAADVEFETQLNERRPGILQGLVIDVDGNPIVGQRIGLEQITTGRPLKPFFVKTNKRGEFLYPRLDMAPDGYKLIVESEDLLIYQFHIKTRTGQGIILQDQPGTLTPDSQNLFPKISYRLGNATIYLRLATREQFQAIWQAKAEAAAAEAGETVAAAGAEGAAPVDRGKPLTPLEEAEQALALGDYPAAASLLEAVIAESPDDPDLHWKRAEALAKARDTSGAVREANKVIGLDPDRPGVRLQLVRWMGDIGSDIGVLALLEKERELSPDDIEVVKLLAERYDADGRTDDYRATLADWEVLAPDDPELLLSLAQAASAEGDFARSEELYARLAASDPSNAAQMFLNVGASILNKPNRSEADTDRAISAFRRSIEADPEYARPHYELAIALLGKGDNAGAKESLTRYVEIAHPSEPNVATAKGLLEAL